MNELTQVDQLYPVAVMAEWVSYDWSSETSWEYLDAVTCEECGQVVIGVTGEGKHADFDHGSPCGGYVTSEGPMMTGYWPLPGFDRSEDDTVLALHDLPLCLVAIETNDYDELVHGLALTGGGMDLSWEIVTGYMRLGYLPPAALYDLPNLAGMTLTPEHNWVLDGVKASGQFLLDRGKMIVERAEAHRARMALQDQALRAAVGAVQA